MLIPIVTSIAPFQLLYTLQVVLDTHSPLKVILKAGTLVDLDGARVVLTYETTPRSIPALYRDTTAQNTLLISAVVPWVPVVVVCQRTHGRKDGGKVDCYNIPCPSVDLLPIETAWQKEKALNTTMATRWRGYLTVVVCSPGSVSTPYTVILVVVKSKVLQLRPSSQE